MSYQSPVQYSSLENTVAGAVPFYEKRDVPVDFHRHESLIYIWNNHLPIVEQYRVLAYQPALSLELKPEYAFTPEPFLKPGRASQPFVGDAAAVADDVKEAFWMTTGKTFPSDIRIAILDNRSFNKQVAHPGVVGFSLNRKEFGMASDVVARAGAKDSLMLTIGHEIGHVLTRTLRNHRHEEVKAFAFSRAWMKCIRDKNIAGLGGCILLDNPARNGLHDVASTFVWRMMAQGQDALQLYWDIVAGRVPYVI